jgi:nicotinamide riboside kinase
MIRIAIVGPESTGKSDITKALAKIFSCHYTEEIAREYLTQREGKYSEEDLSAMAKLQCEAEDKITLGNMLICDTTTLVIKIWSDVKYGRCSKEITDLYLQRKYDYTLLTDIDLPWSDDPLREHPSLDDRKMLMDLYKIELIAHRINFGIVSGIGEARINKALQLIQSHFPNL